MTCGKQQRIILAKLTKYDVTMLASDVCILHLLLTLSEFLDKIIVDVTFLM